MKKLYFVTIILALFCSAFYFGCQKTEENPVDPGTPTGGEGATASYNSTTNGTLNFDGFSLVVDKGDVPAPTSGSGNVTFSLNSSGSIESGVTAVPAGYTVIGKYLKAGPESFYFNAPITIYFPASSQPSPQNLAVMYYAPETQSWKIVNVGVIDTAGKRVGIDVLSLGYYVLVKRNATDAASDYRQGGCVFDHEEVFTNYILTVKSAALEKPEQLGLFANGFIGGVYTGPIFLGCPQGKTKAIVPQGTIEFWVSYSICTGSDPRIYTYTLPATVTVSDPLNFVGWSTYDAVTYVPFLLPPGGTWVLGRPSGTGSWPQATVPYGSGVLQATLTWVNTSANNADMDLHLYGPNNIHIYYSNRTTADFSLDRDWQSTLGNATENIYSLNSTMPSGAYSVKVKHYSGNPMSFNTRVVLNGSSTNYSGSTTSGQEVTVKTFTIP
jgi:hypothetical protein